jgi:hypothetical protein
VRHIYNALLIIADTVWCIPLVLFCFYFYIVNPISPFDLVDLFIFISTSGGNCTNAWPMITGSRNQFMIQFNPTTNSYFCMAKYSPNAGWSAHSNSPHDSNESYWNVDWPSVGGGCADGDISKGISANELFYKIVAWDQTNYLIGAATVGNSDAITTDGIVDNHAYSVIDSREDICGTGIDLLLIRNPWGKGNGLKNGKKFLYCNYTHIFCCVLVFRSCVFFSSVQQLSF